MGKKKGKKVNLEKQEALEARKEAKAEKAAKKRLLKEGDGNVHKGQEDNNEDLNDSDADVDGLDALLQQYKVFDHAGKTTTVESLDSFPLPRANGTLTLYEDAKKKNAELYLFGGEFYDGVANIFLNVLLKYEIGKNQWKQIHCPLAPPPRCAHSSCYYNHALYLFGGEIKRGEQFHHYKDLWRYDIKEQIWEELKPAKAVGTHPTPRSGHTAVVWKNYMVIFGGFFEASKDTPRWYNDVCVFDMKTQQWMDIPHSKLAIRPEPRSACNAAVVGDDLVIHGGFAKLTKSAQQRQKAGELEVQSESLVHTDAWILHLTPLLSEKPPVWERMTSSVQRTIRTVNKSPNGRAAMASAGYKGRLLVFGGVFDTEAMHHKLNSIFYNDTYVMDVDRRKWFPVSTFPVEQVANGEKSDNDEFDGDDNLIVQKVDENLVKDNAWNLEKLRSKLGTFYDGDGTLIHEQSENNNDEDERRWNTSTGSSDGEEKEEEKDGIDTGLSGHCGIKNSSVINVNLETRQPEAMQRTDPLPRINSSMLVLANTAYLYGGLLEVGERELTLDDMWSLDLKKRQWKCLWPGTMHKQVWRGTLHDDEDSNYTTDNKSEKEDSEEDDDEDEKHTFGEHTNEMSKKDQIKARLANLREEHGLADPEKTPAPGEPLSDFFARTSDYWKGKTGLSTETGASLEEIETESFIIAKQRYKSLVDVLSEFIELETQYRIEKKSKKDRKKSSKH
jgi:N-acetylneuraminic acid mutarotase